MKLSEAMREKMLLSFELFPPKTEKGMENLPGTIEHLMKYKPEYISCTYGAGGGNVGANREVCQMIKNAGTVPVTHFTVIKNTKEGDFPVPLQCSAEVQCRSQTSSGWLRLPPISYNTP